MASPPGGIALARYLGRHVEPGLPGPGPDGARWRQVAVLPAYREPPTLLQQLRHFPAGAGRSLVILVLNRPDTDGDPLANSALRAAIQQAMGAPGSASPPCAPLNDHADVYLLDLEALRGPTPALQGVGLARKAGSDLALTWMASGAIAGDWICSIDADATLPGDYFKQLKAAGGDAVAAVFPFRHVPGGIGADDAATALYELRLHHHVLGLEYAGSPYAFHALGSCLAVRANAYTQVRGFPRRAGAEDFYLLNKVAKLGTVARLRGSCIHLQSRPSSRVPFGTGPAVRAIAGAAHPAAAPVFYHPHCYAMLRALLGCLPELAADPERELADLLAGQGLAPAAARQAHVVLLALGLERALAHCRRQGRSSAQFLRQFHQWFDAFRTLKFIHAIRDAGHPMQSLAQLGPLQPCLWPAAPSSQRDVDALRVACARHWGWR